MRRAGIGAAVAALGVALAVPAPAGADELIGCDAPRATLEVKPNLFHNRAITELGQRAPDSAIHVRVTGDREFGSETCAGTVRWRLIDFDGGPGADELLLSGVGLTDPYNPGPYDQIPPEIRVRASGGAAEDDLFGHPGPDRLGGGPGRDRLIGGRGRDELLGGEDPDVVSGGPGADFIDVAARFRAGPSNRDVADCGPGRDTAIVDELDRVEHCERVRERADA